MNEALILGIDIGIANTGVALIREKDASLVNLDYIKTSPDMAIQDRIRIIHDRVEEILLHHNITTIAYEEIHFSPNVLQNAPEKSESMFRLNLVIGTILLLCSQFSINPAALSPVKVKLLIGGTGYCEKTAIQKRLLYVYPQIKSDKQLLKLFSIHHVSDALAQARTAYILNHPRH